MDAVNWLANGHHGDAPEGVCPVIRGYVIGLNDGMPDDQRQRLLGYLSRIAGSHSVRHEQARAEVLARGAVRVLAAFALDTAKMTTQAEQLRALPPDVDIPTAVNAALNAARAAPRTTSAAAKTTCMEGYLAAARAAASTAQGACAKAYLAAAAARAAGAAASAAASAAAETMEETPVWDAALALLDKALTAGPQGEQWSAVQVTRGRAAYIAAGGIVAPIS